MQHNLPALLPALRERAAQASARALVPFSDVAVGVAVLLADGQVIPGVRVESASYGLVIPALQNALTTAVALARTDVVAAVQSSPFLPEDLTYLDRAFPGPLQAVAPDVVAASGGPVPAQVLGLLAPFLDARVLSDAEGIALARLVAGRAHVPESEFPVGCVAEDDQGRLIPGVNVEHPDWTRTLCAERNALGMAVSYGIAHLRRFYLTCPRYQGCTPCGACRQLLAELAGEAAVVMDRGERPTETASPAALLPGFFSGSALGR